ncbi:ATP-binding protein [soil metagenome]
MSKPRDTIRESERLKQLKSYNILDTITEKDYEEITFMASIICDVPIALISFVDKDRQWFKSHKGLSVTETLREYSFCSRALDQPTDSFIVEDSRLDDRFKDNPYVTGSPNIVFYAGIPLINELGYGLGTVCVIDNKPRVLTDQQLTGLKILSNQVMNLLQLRKTNEDLIIAKQQLEIQNKILDDNGKELVEMVENLVSSRVEEVAAQNIELEKMNKELQAFTFISNHDLQEPLRKIQSFVSLISEREAKKLSPKGQEYLLIITKAAERMRALIRDLLAYSRVTETKMIFEETSLQNVVNEIKFDLKAEIAEKYIHIAVMQDCNLKVIPFQFQQLIYNLISNSIKFSRPDVQSFIKIYCELNTGAHFDNNKLLATEKYFCINVIDNGIGFNNEYNEKIFEPFQRLHPKQTQKGTGIGLTIVKKIVENHKGIISAHSDENSETSFKIYIPEIK